MLNRLPERCERPRTRPLRTVAGSITHRGYGTGLSSDSVARGDPRSSGSTVGERLTVDTPYPGRRTERKCAHEDAVELMALMVIVGLVAAGLILVALTVAAAVVGALAWLFLAAASTASSVAA